MISRAQALTKFELVITAEMIGVAIPESPAAYGWRQAVTRGHATEQPMRFHRNLLEVLFGEFAKLIWNGPR